ncbi:DUF928 domain-containing protein [Phormidium sp. CLA17]|uniref:DUF928 domain-containing protein n=1 Tax=Leptolyngbya sp. Cla-17 TaxID=2803751 RepID=UPI001492BF44|nr:DUF928 domain-containing protein [Leptolyngbya sp. Cla-17]MBM0741573.1 DUF928 domain-containing protein [Leptolyngbya sp. Cla-17]
MVRPIVDRKSITASMALVMGLAIAISPLVALAQQYTPPKRGIPGRREGAGTRSPGSCVSSKKSLTALSPTDSFSTTTSPTPTLFWYIPKTKAEMGELRITDDSDKDIYSAVIPLKGGSEVMSHSVPKSVTKDMEAGKDYRWQFALICDADQPSMNPFVEGIVQRVKVTGALSMALEKAFDVRDRASIYASSGIWQDAISTLAQERCIQPKDSALLSSWNTLLKSVRLEAFAQEPLSRTCTTIGVKQ